jgi:hypothetical protein
LREGGLRLLAIGAAERVQEGEFAVSVHPEYGSLVERPALAGRAVEPSVPAQDEARHGVEPSPPLNACNVFSFTPAWAWPIAVTHASVAKEPGRSAQAKSYVWAQMTDGSGRDGGGPRIKWCRRP